MLVHLDVLALAAVALHELLLARDGRGRLADHAARPGVGRLALQEVRGVAAAEGGQAAVAQLPDALHDVVQEGPVVRGHQERAAAPDERRLQPLERRDVEVVGGLVEHEQVRVGHQQARQGHARLLAPGELGRGAVPALAADTQAGQRLLDALVEVVAVERLEAVAQRRVGGRLHGRGALRLQGGQLALHALDLGGAAAHDGTHRRGAC